MTATQGPALHPGAGFFTVDTPYTVPCNPESTGAAHTFDWRTPGEDEPCRQPTDDDTRRQDNVRPIRPDVMPNVQHKR